MNKAYTATAVFALLSCFMLKEAAAEPENRPAAEFMEEQEQSYPCPPFWRVVPNPSVENSLSYVHDSGSIAVSVSYIADRAGDRVSAETFASVASALMNCSLPQKSNLLQGGASFNCENGIEALVYGESGNLVLLSISGRAPETETYLDGFIKFLIHQAAGR